jgi:hypothetical protein
MGSSGFFVADLSCRTGPLRVGRPLRDVCTLSWQDRGMGPPVGRVGIWIARSG